MKDTRTFLLAAVLVLGAGCAVHQAGSSDSEAMALYRECMRDTPGSWGATDYSGALSNHSSKTINGSAVTLAREDLEYRDQTRCMQEAGWDAK